MCLWHSAQNSHVPHRVSPGASENSSILDPPQICTRPSSPDGLCGLCPLDLDPWVMGAAPLEPVLCPWPSIPGFSTSSQQESPSCRFSKLVLKAFLQQPLMSTQSFTTASYSVA